MLNFQGLINLIKPNVEIEVKFKDKPYKVAMQYQRLLSWMPEHDYEESVVSYYNNNIRKIEGNTTRWEQKNKIKDFYYDFFTISVSEELPVQPVKGPVKYKRFRKRHSFIINKYRLDLTEVNNQYEIELEYIGNVEDFNIEELEREILKIYKLIHQSEHFITHQQIEMLNRKKITQVKARNIKFIDLTFGGIVGGSMDYVVAHKADGQTQWLIFNQGVWLVSKNYNLLKIDTDMPYSIYECEVINNLMVDGINVPYYILIYDCLYYEKNIEKEPLLTRRQYIKNVLTITSLYHIVEKPVLKLTSFFNDMMTMFNEQQDLLYPQDGFIFTPMGEYNYHSDQLPLYKRTLRERPDVCKWKPPHRITIDFRVDAGALLVYDMNLKKEVPFKGSAINPLNGISPLFNNYKGKIVESYYDVVCKLMIPIKWREDKDGPNRLDIAESNWLDIHDPILDDDLKGRSIELVKKYHNQVKNSLYGLPTIYPPLLSLPINYKLLDIGGGRGGDLHKWFRSKASHVYTVEPNEDNLKELKSRLQSFKGDVTIIPTIGEDTETIVSTVGKVDVISLMLSLSFFSGDHLDALVNTIASTLKVGGLVIFLTIDGSKLKSGQFNEAKFTIINHMVQVEIPGIVGKQWEFLVDLSVLTEKLSQYGIELVETRPATDELLLSADNMSYTSLFTYGYYKRVKDIKPPKGKKLSTITYPVLPDIKMLTDEEQASIQSPFGPLIRIGCNHFTDALLKSFNAEYQEDFSKRLTIVNNYKQQVLKYLPTVWSTYDGGLLPYLLLQGEAVLLSQLQEIVPVLYNLAAQLSQMTIYIFNQDFKLLQSSYQCGEMNDAIMLLSIDGHIDLLSQKTDGGLKTYFQLDDAIHYKLKKMVKIPTVKNIRDILGPIPPKLNYPQYEPIHQLVRETYPNMDMEQYYQGLTKTINKIYKGPIDVVDLFTSTNKREDLHNLLKSLKKHPAKTQRVHERVSWIDELLQQFNVNVKTMSILDIGAGKGEIITAIQQKYHLPKNRVYAIDIKLPVLKNVTTLSYVKNKIPLPDKSMDVILLLAVLHHIDVNQRVHLLKEIKRILVPGGYVIIREHDDNKQVSFLTFIELIHLFWYEVENEEEDLLSLMTKDDIKQLFNGFTSVYSYTYPDPNPQRLYNEVFRLSIDSFPYESLKPDNIDEQFKQLKTYKLTKNPIHFNITDYFMIEFKVKAHYLNQPSPWDYWQKYKKLNKNLIVSSFNPAIMVHFIKKFKATKVLDFAAGWGDRLIGALAANIQFYCGVDPFLNYQEMIDYFSSTTKVEMIQSSFVDAVLPQVDFNLVLTSPPHFNAEIYIKPFTDLTTWFDDYLIASLNKAWDALGQGHMVIILSDIPGAQYTEDMVTVFNQLHPESTYLGIQLNNCYIWKK